MMETADGESRHGVALFGLGRIGLEHFKNMILNPRVNLKWIVEGETEKATNLLKKYCLPSSCKVIPPENANDVYSDPETVAVIVCSPSFTHEEIVKAALQAGKAVFCEKPVAPSLLSVKACFAEAEKQKRKLFCGFNRRHDDQARSLYNQIREGVVGKIHMIKTCSRDPVTLATDDYFVNSGGYPHDSAVHDLDVVCWLMGEKPSSLYAQGYAHGELFKRLKDVDTLVILLQFPSGGMAVIDLSRNSTYGFDQRIEVFGSKGILFSDNPKPMQTCGMSENGGHCSAIHNSFLTRYEKSYKNELEHFLNVLEGSAPLEVLPEEVIMTSTLATACQKSLETGQSVQLAWDKA